MYSDLQYKNWTILPSLIAWITTSDLFNYKQVQNNNGPPVWTIFTVNPFTPFWAWYDFLQNPELNTYLDHLLPLFNCYHISFQKNVMKRFTEKWRNVDFGHRNCLFTPIMTIITIFVKNTTLSL